MKRRKHLHNFQILALLTIMDLSMVIITATKTSPDLTETILTEKTSNNLLPIMGRTFSKMKGMMNMDKMSSSMKDGFSALKSNLSEIMEEIKWEWEHKNDPNVTLPIKGGDCQQLLAFWQIPVYVIAPAVLVGIIVFILGVGVGTIFLGSAVTGPFFKGLRFLVRGDEHNTGNNNDDDGNSGYGYGPSTTPPSSKQSLILEAISNLGNIFNKDETNENNYGYEDSSGYNYYDHQGSGSYPAYVYTHQSSSNPQPYPPNSFQEQENTIINQHPQEQQYQSQFPAQNQTPDNSGSGYG